MATRSSIPMFHRRLLLIAGSMVGVVMLLGTQLSRLTLVQGAEHRARAEARLERRSLLPTYRGTIYDRQGRALAVDRPGYAIAVRFDVITGTWELARARLQARRAIGGTDWAKMTAEERAAAARERLPEWQARSARLWAALMEHGGIDRDELEERRQKIQEDVEDLALDIRKKRARAEALRLGEDPETHVLEATFGPIVEQTIAHVILPSVDDPVAFEFRALALELPDMIEVQNARRREYPWASADVRIDRRHLPRRLAAREPLSVEVHGVADHILGRMRDVQAADVARRPYSRPDGTPDLGGYRPVGDVAGARGLERAFEDYLRGSRGSKRRRVDTNEEERIPFERGGDLHLTLDIRLQARVQALLTDEIGLTTVQPYHKSTAAPDPGGLPPGWPLNSSAVVIEVATGEILAMVSMPTRAMGAYVAQLDGIRETIDTPWVNRPAEGIYPPGSIIKPLVLVSAVDEGVVGLDEAIECTGHFFPGVTTHARCWIYREYWDFTTHGPLLAPEAIGRSCNIYFYTIADRMGMQVLTERLRAFGLGAPLDVGLLHETRDEPGDDPRRVGENGGYLLSDEQIAAIPIAERRFDTIGMGIGQGRAVTWTPLQAANAYAMLARGGVIRDATLIASGPERPARRGGGLDLDRVAVDAALEGLRKSVTPGGTGHHITYGQNDTEPIFNVEGVTVWGKTGTAQAPPLRAHDTNGDRKITSDDDGITDLDHAWFVGLVGPNDTKRPMYAIAVLVEYGGSGGRVAGPIANQIIRALQEEGYLPATAFSAEGTGG
jgi:penicillin-binding protein 2